MNRSGDPTSSCRTPKKPPGSYLGRKRGERNNTEQHRASDRGPVGRRETQAKEFSPDKAGR